MRMLAAADRPVTIVIDLNVVRAPREGDRKVGGEAQTYRRAQALRPGFNRAERGFGPVHRAHEPTHLAATGQPVCGKRPPIDRRRHRGRVLHLYRSPPGWPPLSAVISHKAVLDSKGSALSVSSYSNSAGL